MTTSRRARAIAAGTAAAVLPLGLVLAQPAVAAPARTTTGVDAVPTPKISWYDCNDYPGSQCATVKLPRDYDKPNGKTVDLALVKTPARKPGQKIGSLFVNPGGPGGSAADLAGNAASVFEGSVLDRFDVIGIDPRGVNYSQQVKCFDDAQSQQPVLKDLNMPFPVTSQEVKQYSAGAAALGKACSSTGKPLTGVMSTAEDARDMDVIRRAVGDQQLTYLGWSYGTYLGEVYANLFPGRVRSMVLDGVIDPIAWAGTSKTKDTPQTIRLPSGQGGYRALKELLRRCDQVGAKTCSFASKDSLAKFDTLATRLKKHPIVIKDPNYGDLTVDYASMISDVLSGLYDPAGYSYITDELSYLWRASDPKAAKEPDLTPALARSLKPSPQDFPYDNSLEAFTGVLCTDSVNPASVSDWPKAVQKIASSAKYFGQSWAWQSAPCASSTWTVRDEDAYRGPFTAKTSGPVLVVGDYWDPATNYKSAEKVAGLMPNSSLLLSDSWGHTAYGTSACATDAISRALVSTTMPAKGTRCVGDVQPYGTSNEPQVAQRRIEQQTGIDPKIVDEQLRSHPGRY